MRESVLRAISQVINDLYKSQESVELSIPEEKFGEFSTNVALKLATKLEKNPREVAESITQQLRTMLKDQLSDISVAGPGFINLRLNDSTLYDNAIKAVESKPNSYQGQVVVAEYSDPNPFKVLHAGHLYTSVVGDAIANILELAGGIVHRVNFGGDVGLHVARTMYAILADNDQRIMDPSEVAWAKVEGLEKSSLLERASWLADKYVQGTNDYEEGDEAIKKAIVELNKQIYQISENKEQNSALAKIYWTCRKWSYDYFDEFYAQIGVHFEKYYPESLTASMGLAKAKELAEQGILEKSEGAIVFKGEKYGLHTRVFINSQGLPTYESKDLGLQLAKWSDYHFDFSLIITGNDIIEYMKVVLKVVEQFEPKLASTTRHITHGIVKMQGGAKMSSRKGNILKATDVLNAAAIANKELIGQENHSTTLGAVKYAFLKQRIGGDIVYDPKESVSLEGNSGPYLQYAYARAYSLLHKQVDATIPNIDPNPSLEAGERSLARKMGEYPEVLDRAVEELMPHHICIYLYELAQTFNRFYEGSRIIGHERQSLRMQLVKAYSDILKHGLDILNIPSPNHL